MSGWHGTFPCCGRPWKTNLKRIHTSKRSPVADTGSPHRFLRLSRRTCHPRKQSRDSHRDRKSTRLNSSHLGISYAVFCLKKKKLRHLLYVICTVLFFCDVFCLKDLSM